MITAGLVATLTLFNFDIAGGDADEQIREWSRQTHVQVLYKSETVIGVVTQPVRGELEPLQALRVMLRFTDLQLDSVNDHTIAVIEPIHYCHPERGALAPLPPCAPKALVIKASP